MCAQDKTRTCTPEPAPAPQAGVSTNFTTWAVFAQGSVLSAQGFSLRSTLYALRFLLRAQCSVHRVCPALYALCSALFNGAQNRTRTCTSLLTLVPETSASTNFAIWACWLRAQGLGLRDLPCALRSVHCAILASGALLLCALKERAVFNSGCKNKK